MTQTGNFGILSTQARRLYEVNHRDLIRKYISPNPISVPVEQAKQMLDPNSKIEVLRRFASTGTIHDHKSLAHLLYQTQQTSYQRRLWYDQLRLCAEHPYAAGALKLYVDSITGISPMTNASMWVTSQDKSLVNAGNQLFQRLDVDSNIRDWAMRLLMFGDLFLKPYGMPGVGIEFIDDNILPQSVDRIDINGRLEGFVWMGLYNRSASGYVSMESPWGYVHGRVFGSVRKYMATGMGLYGMTPQLDVISQTTDPALSKFVYTTKYGCSLLSEALPIWKRLKMTEETILMARVTRGMIYNMYKIKIGGGNWQAASALVNDYYSFLKRETALDMSANDWQDAFAPIFAQVQDLYVPVTDDMDVTVEKLGGESANITGVKDLEENVKQFMASLSVSKPMLGVEENSGHQLGQAAHKRASINFAKNAQRGSSGIKIMMKRLLQIHFAYLGLNADPTRFDIQLATISSAEEEELKDALSTGMDVIEKYMNVIAGVYGEKITEEVKEEIFDKLTKRLIGVDDLDIMGSIKNGNDKKKINDSQVKSDKKVINECVELSKKYATQMMMCRGDVLNSYLPSHKMQLKETKMKVKLSDGKKDIDTVKYVGVNLIKMSESVKVGGEVEIKSEKCEWKPRVVEYQVDKQETKSVWKK